MSREVRKIQGKNEPTTRPLTGKIDESLTKFRNGLERPHRGYPAAAM
jgi:hypothetical protein